MLITAIEKGKKSPDRYNVYVNGSFLFAVYLDTLSEYNISSGDEIDSRLIDEIIDFDKVLFAKRQSFDILSRRNLSEAMLCDKLRQKQIEESHIISAVEYLKEKGYIDDERFASDRAKYLLEVKRYGVSKIRQELIFKYGIDREIAENITENLPDEQSLENLHTLLEKELGKKDTSDRKILNNIINKFRLKGYTYDDIKSTINDIKEEVEIFD